MHPSRSIAGRSLRLILGLFLFALGVVITLRAELGVSPWDVLHDGMQLQTPLSFGQAVIVIGAVLLICSFLVGIKPGPGTVANMILIGVFEDLMLATAVGGNLVEEALVLRLPLVVLGVLTIGLGSALYIGAEMGAGPRDSLMLAFTKRFGISTRVARTAVEGSALLGGVLLGGQLGLGTLIFVLTIGPAVQLFFHLFGMDETGRRAGPPDVEGF
ncbi:MAG: YczE/YyaS/YitT family protein [Actinomycetota bacterium]